MTLSHERHAPRLASKALLRGPCLRQDDKIVFPRHCGRDRPAMLKPSEHPSVSVSYAVKGFLHDLYATLVVKLADSESLNHSR